MKEEGGTVAAKRGLPRNGSKIGDAIDSDAKNGMYCTAARSRFDSAFAVSPSANLRLR